MEVHGGALKNVKRPVRCVRDVAATETTGQYVAEVNGYPAINLSELSPLGCVLTSAEAKARCKEINDQTPSNTAFLPIGSNVSGHNGTWNAKMSSRFQVMRKNLSSSDWASAYNACKQYEGEEGKKGEWRLPTQREIAMIWVLHPQLIGTGEITAICGFYYWCCTEGSTNRAWNIRFDWGNLTYQSDLKTGNSYNTRCVRDL